ALGEKLGRLGLSYLWIVDDVPDDLDAQTFRRWLAPNALGKTIVTTRSRTYGAFGGVVEVDVLPTDDAYELLLAHRQPDTASEISAARGIVDDLGGHALAVDVAGAGLRASIGLQSFEEFRAALAHARGDELEFA